MMKQNSSTRVYLSRGEFYSLILPPGWESEEDEDCTSFYKPENGLGALQLSAFSTGDRQSSTKVLSEFLEEEAVDSHSAIISTQLQDKEISSSSYVNSDTYFKVWVIVHEERLILATYNRGVDSPSFEEQEVDNMVASINLSKKTG